MPLYEYKCKRCDAVFEVLQKFSDKPLTVHSECGGPVERLISPSALQFKGSGWYITDYARKHSSSGSNGKGSASSDSTAKESKPTASKSSESKATTKS